MAPQAALRRSGRKAVPSAAAKRAAAANVEASNAAKAAEKEAQISTKKRPRTQSVGKPKKKVHIATTPSPRPLPRQPS